MHPLLQNVPAALLPDQHNRGRVQLTAAVHVAKRIVNPREARHDFAIAAVRHGLLFLAQYCAVQVSRHQQLAILNIHRAQLSPDSRQILELVAAHATEAYRLFDSEWHYAKRRCTRDAHYGLFVMPSRRAQPPEPLLRVAQQLARLYVRRARNVPLQTELLQPRLCVGQLTVAQQQCRLCHANHVNLRRAQPSALQRGLVRGIRALQTKWSTI
mmetsp:Transcript_1861/g.4919  ORF Transcript_1861/g.4919 Transcript_1861/m.4919 type:complete len:213 (-) Transcript_1861:1119-1757(-)